jgi:hypothetical protein
VDSGTNVKDVQRHCLKDCTNAAAYREIKDAWVPPYDRTDKDGVNKQRTKRHVKRTIEVAQELARMDPEHLEAEYNKVSISFACLSISYPALTLVATR